MIRNSELSNYRPTGKSTWQGRIDDATDPLAARFHQVVECIDLRNDITVSGKHIKFCILGFCCDEGVRRNHGRVGAADGPRQIRKELAKLPANFIEKASLYDAGDIICDDLNLEKAQSALESAVEILLDSGFQPIVLGGGHEIVLGHYNGVRNHVLKAGNASVFTPPLIINLDAHLDLRSFEKGGTSGTSFYQIAEEHKSNAWSFDYICLGTQTYGNTRRLYKRADELGVHYVDAKDILPSTIADVNRAVTEIINRHEHIYLTLDFDVIDAANAPGVSSTQPFGLDPDIFLQLVKSIISSGKVLSFDVAEVSPRYDDDNQTAKLAAVVIYSMIGEILK